MTKRVNKFKEALAAVLLFVAGVVAATLLLLASPTALPVWLDLSLYAVGVLLLLGMTIGHLFAK